MEIRVGVASMLEPNPVFNNMIYFFFDSFSVLTFKINEMCI